MESNSPSQKSKDDGRGNKQFPFARACQLFPVDDSGKPVQSKGIAIVGRDLSTSEICFSHSLPITQKRAVIILQTADHARCVLEVEVNWSKRLTIGVYETECRLLRRIDKPSAEAAD
jgi:hypothetical protein